MIGLLGVPANSAGATDGVARAPAALREAGLLQALREVGEVHDFGDLILPEPSPLRDPATRIIDPHGLVALVLEVRDKVAPILAAGAFPLVIGGDCPLLLGCLAAAKGPAGMGLLFLDGHEDAYLPGQSSTGEAADMELALALGMADASWSAELAAMLPLVAAGDVRILGARDGGLLEAEGVASLRDRVPVVHGDALASDPAAETGTALAAGPLGWDITIYNPDLDPERVHARGIVAFVAATVGARG